MNIYAGNLLYEVSEDELREIFENYGEVSSAKIIFDRFSGRSKGFGFVEMPNDDEAQKAVDELEGSEVQGRTMKVNKAREREERGRGGFNNRSNY